MKDKEKIRQAARQIWEYHHINDVLEKADCILVLGGHDARVAERGAQLFLEGWAPLLIFSGGFGNLELTRGKWSRPEAEIFAEIAERMGVPRDKILIENKSTNTGENIQFSKNLIVRRGITPQKVILVHKPYMERRAWATFKKIWPGTQVIVTSPQILFEEYPNEEISEDDLIAIMVGDLQRIRLYPEKGFQIYQEIPNDILSACEELVAAGYTAHLLKGEAV